MDSLARLPGPDGVAVGGDGGAGIGGGTWCSTASLRASKTPGPSGSDPGTVNHHHGGRGLYFDDPGGHHFEIITRRYEGSPGR